LATRITADTRQALEAEAERTGRSISQVAEIWLDEARKGRAAYHDRVGGTQYAAAIEKLLEIARDVDERVAEPDGRRDALVAAWRVAVQFVVPNQSVGTPEIEFQHRLVRVQEACHRMLDVIQSAPEGDPVRRRLVAPATDQDKATVLQHVTSVEGGHNWFLGEVLRLLSGAGNTGALEVQTALEEAEKLDAIQRVRIERRQAAAQRGEAIARAHVAQPAHVEAKGADK
jgi:hypothetical protein